MKWSVLFLLLFISLHTSAQIVVSNLTQEDSNSKQLYTCMENLLRIKNMPRGLTVKTSKVYIQQIGNIIKINSPEHDDGEQDTLEFIDGSRMRMGKMILTYVTCIANSKSKVDPFDKKVFIAGKTNKGILQQGYRQYSIKATLAELRNNPRVSISDSAYEINRIILSLACKRCDEIIPTELKSGDLSTWSQFSTLRKGNKVFLDDIQCTRRQGGKKVYNLASIVIYVE